MRKKNIEIIETADLDEFVLRQGNIFAGMLILQNNGISVLKEFNGCECLSELTWSSEEQLVDLISLLKEIAHFESTYRK